MKTSVVIITKHTVDATKVSNYGTRAKYPWTTLECSKLVGSTYVGPAFVVTGVTKTKFAPQIWAACKKYNRKFLQYASGDNEVTVIRVK